MDKDCRFAPKELQVIKKRHKNFVDGGPWCLDTQGQLEFEGSNWAAPRIDWERTYEGKTRNRKFISDSYGSRWYPSYDGD